MADGSTQDSRIGHADPTAAYHAALRDLGVAQARSDNRAILAAERRAGVAASHRGELDDATDHFNRTIALADDLGDRVEAARTRLSLATVFARQGQLDRALAEASAANEHLDGPEKSRAMGTLAVISHLRGDTDACLWHADEAIELSGRLGDDNLLASQLSNRANFRLAARRYREAARDYDRAETLHLNLGDVAAAAMVRHNRALLIAATGNSFEALELIEAADRAFIDNGIDRATALADKCGVLTDSGLLPEALAAGAEAGAQMTASGRLLELADLHLELARSAVMSGDLGAACGLATQAADAFAEQKRDNPAAHARFLAAWTQADAAAPLPMSAPKGSDPAWMLALAHRLHIGLRDIDAATLASEAHRLLGAAPDEDRTELANVRIAAAAALQQALSGHGAASADSLELAIGRATGPNALATSLGFRAALLREASGLEAISTRLAVDSDEPEAVEALFRHVDALRSLHARGTPAYSDDPTTTDLLTEYRSLQMTARGHEFTAVASRRRQVELEAEIGLRTGRTRSPAGLTPHTDRPGGLDERATVMLVTDRGSAFALVRTPDIAPTLVRLETVEAITKSNRRLRRALGAASSADTAHADAARSRVGSLAEALGMMVASPWLPLVGDRPVVIIPSEQVSGVPWAALPGCAGRALSMTTAPSVWHGAALVSQQVQAPLLVAGPDLHHADTECQAVARLVDSPRMLTGANATADGVLQALQTADLAHLAAHGSFRNDNPGFSALRLADRPLSGYDLLTARTLPRWVILSACELGLDQTGPQDAVSGLAATFGARGTRAVVAATAPISDADTIELMEGLYRRIGAGEDLDVALAVEQELAVQRGAPGATAFRCVVLG